MLKVLCFHGFGTNKDILDYQLRQFKKFFKNVQFVSINGPHSLDRSVMNNDPSLTDILEKTFNKCYAWLKILHENPYTYFDQTMQYIAEVIKKEGPFDGLLCFSQGGTIACYFAYYCEFFKEKITFQIPKFVIPICSPGFFPPQMKKKYTIDMPSVHFIGENDFLFERPLYGSTLFVDPILIFHKEGHKIPKLTEHEIMILKGFFAKFLKNNKLNKNQIRAKL